MAFFLSVLGAIIVVVTLYNEQLAWNWMYLEDHEGMNAWIEPLDQTPTDPRDVELRKQRGERDSEQTRLTVQNTETNIGLLGVRIDSADLTVFGSLAMLILSMYFCLCTRRVNHDVGFALREMAARTDPGKTDAMQYVLLGIKQGFVFNVLHTPLETNSLFTGGGTKLRGGLLRSPRSIPLWGMPQPWQ